jgi:hypothetical protein
MDQGKARLNLALWGKILRTTMPGHGKSMTAGLGTNLPSQRKLRRQNEESQFNKPIFQENPG